MAVVHEERPLVHISLAVLHTSVLFFFYCNFLTPGRNEVLVVLRQIPMLGANKAADSTALALRRLLKVKPLPGYIGLEKRKTVCPAVCEMNVRA